MKPEVGIGATYCIGSDRYAYKVVRVTPATVTVVRRGGSTEEVFTRRKDGRYVRKGSRVGYLYIGVAEDYRDPSF